MLHFKETCNVMTFVDLVFPAFIFIVGMSIPFALGARLKRGEPIWRTLIHIGSRAFSLLLIGVMMVNETPDSKKMGWSANLWVVLMFLSAIFAFCSFEMPTEAESSRKKLVSILNLILRLLG